MWKKLIKILVVLSLGILCLCSCGEKGETLFFTPQTADTTYGQEETFAEDVAESTQIVVHVCGAVCEPGVFALEKGSRAVDAIALAGGMNEYADGDYINLASILQDGEKLYVPTKQETLLWKEAEAKSSFVNINTASSDELCTLPGIGESKAADIIAYREKHGAFSSKEDIMKVGGIKESLFAGIEEFIIVE